MHHGESKFNHHFIPYGIASRNNDEWKETWMSHPIYVQEKWLPKDMENNTHILSLSYDSNMVASVHENVM